jgi:3-deoxy-D-manno-octulosonic-acid transferase
VRLLYTALFHALTPFILARLAWRSRKLPAYRERWGERFARYPKAPEPPGAAWFHAVSVGEAEAAFPVIREFRARHPGLPVLVTCTTPTGSARIRAVLGEGARHVYLPYDLPGCVARFLDRFQPCLGVIMETEIWPNLYRECGRRGIPLAIVNGRLSAKSARGYRRVGRLAADSLSWVALIAAQTQLDAERYIGIGADPSKVQVAGNVKFDIEFSPAMRQRAAALRAELFPHRPIWIAGSTHAGEEEPLLATQAEVSAAIPGALLILAPRHPERNRDVLALCAKAGLAVRRRSEALPCDSATQVFLLDSLGELRLFYGAADAAFVGGSLVPTGGHNVLEPAAAGVPTLFGPHMFNFAEIAQRLKESGGGAEIGGAGELVRQMIRLLGDPAARAEIGTKAQGFVSGNQGAVERVSGLIAALLPVEASGGA